MRSKLRTLIDEKKVPVGKALRNLDSALAYLDELLTNEYRWVSVEGESTQSAAMAKVRAVYKDIDGDPIPERKAMPGCRGIVAVTLKVIEAACSVNIAKAELQAACVGLRGNYYVQQSDRGERVTLTRSRLSLALDAVGRPNLNMFAAYRKVPILTGAPRRVGFTIGQFHSVFRTPRNTISSRLRTRADGDSIEDFGRVQQLPQFEAELALLTISRPYPQASVWFDGFDAQGRCHENMLTGLPILYIAAAATPSVSYTAPKTSPPRRCSVRAVCPERYLKTMRVHRYLRFMDEAETRSARGWA